MYHPIILFLAIVIFACYFAEVIAVMAWALYVIAELIGEEDYRKIKEEFDKRKRK